jgi:hypothetical protein
MAPDGILPIVQPAQLRFHPAKSRAGGRDRDRRREEGELAMAIRPLVFAALAVLIVAAAFFVVRVSMKSPGEMDLALSKTTAKGLYVVAVQPEGGHVPVLGIVHSWILTLKTPDGAPVDDAAITVEGDMPEHGHGLPTAPVVGARLGQGRYRIDGLKFTMRGWWELKFAIRAAKGEDRAVFNLVL